MENLNKENFWNALYEKYPNGMKVFCDWIDEYKRKNNWNCLFGKTAFNPDIRDTKFHDIPLAMQIGIWIEFVCDRGGCRWKIKDMFTFNWKREIKGYLKMLEAEHEIYNYKNIV